MHVTMYLLALHNFQPLLNSPKNFAFTGALPFFEVLHSHVKLSKYLQLILKFLNLILIFLFIIECSLIFFFLFIFNGFAND